MRTRPTATRPPKPLTRAMVHRILSSPYYLGKLRFNGAVYDGTHEALIDPVTWRHVQDVLAGRRLAGDRSWRHDHYLKGSLFCATCGSRLGLSNSKGRRGTIYPHFFCIGRAKKRSDCQQPYLPVEKVEGFVIRHWTSLRLDPELVDAVRESVAAEFAAMRAENETLLRTQKARILKLERQRQKLIDAYLAEALPVIDLKQRQEAVAVEQREAERLIAAASANHELAEQRLEIALQLLEQCDRLYASSGDEERRAFNQAFFGGLFIGPNGVEWAALNPPFAELWDRSIGLIDDGPDDGGDDPHDDPDGPEPHRPVSKPNDNHVRAKTTNTNPAGLTAQRGSNVTLLAEREGFEPSMQLPANRLSKAAP